MFAAVGPHATGGWIQHVWWWWESHTGTVNEGGPWYGALSGYVGDLPLSGLFITGLFGLRHTYKRHECGVNEPNCKRIATHEYVDRDGVSHRVCKPHHPALGPDHKLRHVDMLEHHREMKHAAPKRAPRKVTTT